MKGAAPASIAGRAPGRGRLQVGVYAALGGCVGAICALAPPDLPAALLVVTLLALPIALAIPATQAGTETRSLLALFLGALLVRAGVALAIHYLAPAGFFALDDHKYAVLGAELSAHWFGDAPFPPDLHGRLGYYAWNAVLYAVLGPVPLAPTLANAVFGAVTVLLAYAIARELGGSRAGIVAAGLAAFWPSLVLWSSLNLKDALALVAILLTLRGAQRLQDGWANGAVVQLLVGLVLLSNLRGYLTLIAGLAVGLAWLLPRLRRAPLVGAALLIAAALVLPALGPVQELAEEASLESLDRTRRKLALGASAYHGDVDLTTPGSALRFLPTGLTYFLLAPAPWQLWNARQVLTLPEMLAWYAVVPLVIRGALGVLRERFAAAAPIAIFAGLATVSYALVEGNLGTAYRHRAQVMILFLIFGAVGWVRAQEAASRRREKAAELRAQGPVEVPA